MARISNNEAMFRWVQDHVLNGSLTPGRGYSGDTVRTNNEGALVYVRTEKPGKSTPIMRRRWSTTQRQYIRVESGTRIAGQRYAYGPVTLGIYIPKTKTFLLNGDGFTDNAATEAQTLLRGLIQTPNRAIPPRQGRWIEATLRLWKTKRTRFRNEESLRYVIVPFQALEGANAVPESVKPIDVTRDTNVWMIHGIPDQPPTLDEFFAVDPEPMIGHTRYRAIRKGQTWWRIRENGRWTAINPAGDENLPYNHGLVEGGYEASKRSLDLPGWFQGYPIKEGWKVEQRWHLQASNTQWSGLGSEELDGPQPALEILARRQTQTAAMWISPLLATAERKKAEPILDSVPVNSWYWREQVHQLGASLFSAIGEDGRRHKFISAFDNQEFPAMYFLAQLPDGSGATTYQQAMDALAPEIVHKARAENREVYRQGDIFAIATNLTDEEVYARARTRVRRQVAYWNINDWAIQQEMHAKPRRETRQKAVAGEVMERVTCPCGCGKSKRVAWGPRARRALSIYRTGHTATEVVVTRSGATYVRGRLHHDPQIETPGRPREHRDTNLHMQQEDEKRWFICVRNTVPRRRAVTTDSNQATEGEDAMVVQDPGASNG